jgi:hypothetical protein
MARGYQQAEWLGADRTLRGTRRQLCGVEMPERHTNGPAGQLRQAGAESSTGPGHDFGAVAFACGAYQQVRGELLSHDIGKQWGLRPVDFLKEGVVQGEQVAGTFQQYGAGRSEPDPAGGPVEQDSTGIAFEGLDLAADRLLGHMQLLRRLREVQPFGGCDEVTQPAKIKIARHPGPGQRRRASH